ncbi:Quinone oxidoreductase [Pantoea sp. AS-PWVM4]|uniref:Quinone oxidoreductase n=1 Tax=Pantoea phytobeneficialis TaxID=2052056 RepID=A0AAP9H7R2_9GAMM|nr:MULTISPECIES: NAD(P)H-quinone oxidoreductase [Pantoea]ERK07388.1 Quinone oxidoreductase [Pantoea sp. AS-PWVM4]MDO6405305.1 NAD(P)H-quinone oxidoreductase [Pantoea phytobeneficialis]QGR07824.1 quinone oxidoreductase [Pantoea phytobeneficialis]
MKAITFDQFGPAEVLTLTEVAEPVLRPQDLLVRTRAAGVNRADLTHRRGGYGRPDFGDSTLMGLEIAGDVIAVGAEVSGYKVGDRVMGIVGGGAYAEVARIDYRMAMPIPDSLNYVQAAAITEVFVTANEALVNLGKLQAGETVLIHAGAGGVGGAAVQLAHAIGATVITTAQASAHQLVRRMGADYVIDYVHEDFATVVDSLTEKRGVDLILDFIGAPYFERNVNALNFGGRLVQIGIMGGIENAKIPLDRLLYRHLQIFGTVMKSRSQEVKHAMSQRFRERWLSEFGKEGLAPIIDSVYPLAEAAAAHQRMEEGLNVGKIVLTA